MGETVGLWPRAAIDAALYINQAKEGATMAHHFDGYQILEAVVPGRGTTKVFWAPWRRRPDKLYHTSNYEKALELRRRLTEEGPAGSSTEIIYWGGTNFVVARYAEEV